jgi:hypothetical protein
LNTARESRPHKQKRNLSEGTLLNATVKPFPTATLNDNNEKMDEFLLPSSAAFSVSGNGRRGFNVDDVYDLISGRKVRVIFNELHTESTR